MAQGGSRFGNRSLAMGIPLWFGWEYARPTWTTGVITGTEVRRSDPDARGNTTDIISGMDGMAGRNRPGWRGR